MDERKGYQFLLDLAKDASASDSDRRAAIEQLPWLGDANTLDEMIALAETPGIHNIRPTIIATISKLQTKLDNIQAQREAKEEKKPRKGKGKSDDTENN